MQEERDYLESLRSLFEQAGGKFYFVELSATIEERLARNETLHRMEKKASKKDVVWSKANLLQDAENHKLNTDEGEIWFENHLKVDNTDLGPDEVADRVIKEFGLVPNEKEEKEYRFGA